jgi:hypothetical protein
LLTHWIVLSRFALAVSSRWKAVLRESRLVASVVAGLGFAAWLVSWAGGGWSEAADGRGV